MNVCELYVETARSDRGLAAARWELFAFPEVSHVYRVGTTNRAAVLYVGGEPDLGRWLAALREAGIEAYASTGAGSPDQLSLAEYARS